MIGFAQVLLLDETDPARREPLERIVAEAQQIAKILRDLLVFARRERPIKVESRLNHVAALVVDGLRTAFAEANIAVETDLGEVPPFRFDPDQLKCVLGHLLRNALEAIRDHRTGGRVRVRTALQNGHASLEVEDDGPGVNPNDVERLFFPFFTTKGVGVGTGLGLAYSHGVAVEHGGDLRYRPTVPHGATFTLTLPLTPEAAPPGTPAAGAARAASAAGAGAAEVLVVDDEPAVRAYLRAALRRAGHAITEVESAEEALALLRAREFDAILLDMKMPGMGGRALYEWLARERPALAARVIFETGDTVAPATVEFLRQTGRPVLAKPFSVDELTRALGEVIIASAEAAGVAKR